MKSYRSTPIDRVLAAKMVPRSLEKKSIIVASLELKGIQPDQIVIKNSATNEEIEILLEVSNIKIVEHYTDSLHIS